MSQTTMNLASDGVVLLANQNGIAVIPASTPLTRLNYFDGKFLRAEDMSAEQQYLRNLVQVANRGGGLGVVDGFDVVLASGGSSVTVAPGLAFDATGRTLLLPLESTFDLDTLIKQTQQLATSTSASVADSSNFADCVVTAATAGVSAAQTANLYLLTVGFLEAACGEEDVLGQVCQQACANGKDRRYRIEGVIFRALPLSLSALPYAGIKSLILGNLHLRSRVASAYFADERARVASLISGAGIRGATWCHGAAPELGTQVPLAVFSRAGTVTQFIDAWTVRRERIETPPQRYWAWRMAMRPWDAFLAQILQFQCQLHDVLLGVTNGGTTPVNDPCAKERQVIVDANQLIGQLETYHATLNNTLSALNRAGNSTAIGISPFSEGVTAITALKSRLAAATQSSPSGSGDRLLIDGGFVELPSAGYLPMVAGTEVTINEQVRKLMGPGVDLRFCIVTPDYVPHALEEAQHMDRISLVDGIEDSKQIPPVDILVPNGKFVSSTQRDGDYYEVRVNNPNGGTMRGAGHSRSLKTGGGEFYFAGSIENSLGIGLSAVHSQVATFVRARTSAAGRAAEATAAAPAAAGATTLAVNNGANVRAGAANATKPSDYVEMSITDDPFVLGQYATTDFRFRVIALTTNGTLDDTEMRGTLSIESPARNLKDTVTGTLNGQVSSSGGGNPTTAPLAGVPFSITRQITGALSSLEITLGTTPLSPSTRAVAVATRIRYEWQGSPLNGKLTLFNAGSNTSVATATVLGNPDVAQLSNPTHIIAESALDAVATPLNQQLWRQTAERNLFPVTGPSTQLDVIGTLDWVMFHRRRVRNCGGETAAPVTRRLAVFLYDVADFPDAFIQFHQELLSTDQSTIDKLRSDKLRHKIDTVQVSDGRLQRGDLAAQDLKGFDANRKLLWIGIAMGSPQDPAGVQIDYLDQYENAVGGVIDLTGVQGPETINVLPPAVAEVSSNGAIILFTQTVAEQVSVWRIDPGIVNVDLEARFANITDPFSANSSAQLMGLVGFNAINANAAELKSVADKWAAAGAGVALESFVFYPKAATGISSAPTNAVDRANVIDTQLGASSATKTIVERDAIMTQSEALAVLVAPSITATIFLANANRAPELEKILRSVTAARPLDEAAVKSILTMVTALGTYNIDQRATAVIELSQLQKLWSQLVTPANGFGNITFPSRLAMCWADDGVVGASTGLVDKRAQAIVKALPADPTGGLQILKVPAANTTPKLSLFSDAPLASFLFVVL